MRNAMNSNQKGMFKLSFDTRNNRRNVVVKVQSAADFLCNAVNSVHLNFP
jgi:hypothetical protein